MLQDARNRIHQLPMIQHTGDLATIQAMRQALEVLAAAFPDGRIQAEAFDKAFHLLPYDLAKKYLDLHSEENIKLLASFLQQHHSIRVRLECIYNPQSDHAQACPLPIESVNYLGERSKKTLIRVQLEVAQHQVQALLDTGAEPSILPARIFAPNKAGPMMPLLKSASGDCIWCTSPQEVEVRIKGQSIHLRAHLTELDLILDQS
jgi:hypothetical protein